MPRFSSEWLREREAKQRGKFAPTLAPDPTDAVLKERLLHDSIIQHCLDQGWQYFHGSMAHRAMRTPGEPDFIIQMDGGRTLWVECKKKGEKPTKEQRDVIAHAAKLGHTVHVVRSMEEFRFAVNQTKNP